jgi:hypothetical protein
MQSKNDRNVASPAVRPKNELRVPEVLLSAANAPKKGLSLAVSNSPELRPKNELFEVFVLKL